MKRSKTFLISALSFTMIACSQSTASSAPASSSTSEESTSEVDAKINDEKEPEKEIREEEEAEVVTSAKYTVTNTTGETITELYLYETGTEDKGTNYAEGGLANGASVTIDVQVEEDKAADYTSTLEFTTESGQQSQFTTLYLEEVTLNLLSNQADAYTSATPFEWAY